MKRKKDTEMVVERQNLFQKPVYLNILDYYIVVFHVRCLIILYLT